jgi:orotate phosphoribosyltransferase
LGGYPAERARVADALAEAVRARSGSLDVIASATTSSMLLATLLARRLEKPMVYLRARAKGHGTRRQVEGRLAEPARILLVMDVVSDAQRVLESIELVGRNGSRVVACVSLFVADRTVAGALAERGMLLIEAARLDAPSPGSVSMARGERGGQPVGDVAARSGADGAARIEANRRRVAEVLLRIGAVTIDEAHPFRYVSGILSPIYTDNRLLISHPAEWQTIVDAFVDLLSVCVGAGDYVIAGTATAGIPHASMLADRLHRPTVYVEAPKPERAGSVGGFVTAGQPAVMIEDHVTTGNSVMDAARVLRNAGAVVATCLSIFTYLTPTLDERTGIPCLDVADDLRIFPLCDVRTLLDVAVDREQISADQRRSVLQWLEDPNAWSEQHERDAAQGP